MNEQLKELIARRATTMERIWAHYEHAREKHPYFCDDIYLRIPQFDHVGFMLSDYRERIEYSMQRRCLAWTDLLGCETYEVLEALQKGDPAAAIAECYDAIAILLRVIDVVEGRQQLGKPKKKGAVK